VKPIQFPFANKILEKPQGWTDEECNPLPVYNDGQQSISCWELSWKERLTVLVFGRVWLRVVMGHTQPPVLLEAIRTPWLEDPWTKRWEWLKTKIKTE
jgi:hypothetical protein